MLRKVQKSESTPESKLKVPLNTIIEHAQSLSSDLELAVRAASAAGQVIIEGANELSRGESGKIERKGIGDLVSEVDRDADRAAIDVLQSGSSLPILSEELNCDVETEDSMWILDPLDASSAFLMQAGTEYPSVLVAQRQQNETALGVAYFPLIDAWYYAIRGTGAWKNSKRLVCDMAEPLEQVWVEMNQYGDASLETKYFRSLNERLRSDQGACLVTSNVPHAGVAMRIADGNSSLAAAVHDNNPASVKQGPWDIAAPQVILEEAGGVFLNPEGERSDPFTCEPVIVARSRSLADVIVELGKSQRVSG
ncbi:MAG: inositol monophosphatase [Pirellulaceae bacterium]